MWTQLRPVLAAVLAMLFPGLGHVVLRRWRRALLWFLTIMGGGVALLLLYEVDVASSGNSPTEAAAALPIDVAVPLLLLYALSALDAYLVGRADIGEQKRADATAEAIRRRTANADDGSRPDRTTPPVAAVTEDDGEPPEVECPVCGKETDAELDFCHWCTEPLPWANSE